MNAYDRDNDVQAYSPDDRKRSNDREGMKIRSTGYGFFGVGTPTREIWCSECMTDLTHKTHTSINGVNYCKNCLHEKE